MGNRIQDLWEGEKLIRIHKIVQLNLFIRLHAYEPVNAIFKPFKTITEKYNLIRRQELCYSRKIKIQRRNAIEITRKEREN